ncbi:hypothetical protein FOA43_000790 [Brettanomyces nanus]|uniref:Uncharacterized protein n=1 Tax=Eeniella nana TaxID=13502 RepID=A0A875S0T7_EENNA|nr:uncharacterized protein FOA43_000790 [Brettanomyces nanus]QPG73479.1 hypothetical protein FOA43_000790 [Brettanomyces nanus]
MFKIESPDETVHSILEGLCVSSINGVHLPEIWQLSKKQLHSNDSFYKKLVWSWLIREPDFLVYKIIKGKKEGQLILEKMDISEYRDFQVLCDRYGVDNISFKVNGDRQSLYLTGVSMKNNVLGQKPYELLMYIAKAKEHGITSVDLIKESGQDKRSLTSRLQVLEDHSYIKKIPTVVSGFRTYLMVHYRFQNRMDNIPLRFEKYDMMKSIMNELSKAPNGVRVISDLMKQAQADHNQLDRRRFHSIIRILCAKGFTEEVIVLHEESSRRFVGVKILKSLPSQLSQAQLRDLINSPNDYESSPIPAPESELTPTERLDTSLILKEESEVEMFDTEKRPEILYNQIFPLTNQIYDIVKESRGISSTELETRLNGRYRTRVFANALASCTMEKPEKGNPHQIVRQLCYQSKQRFFRLLPLKDYLELNKISSFPYMQLVPPILDGGFNKSLIEHSADEARSTYRQRCTLFEVNDTSLLYWNSYKGEALPKYIQKQKLLGQYESIDGDLLIVFKKSKYRVKKKRVVEIKDNHLTTPISSVYSPVLPVPATSQQSAAEDMEELIQNIYGDKPSKVLEDIKAEPSEQEALFVDKGPRERRRLLLEMIDNQKFCVVNGNLCERLSEALEVDYLIDRKTLIKDCVFLESKGKIKIEKRKVSDKRSLTVLLSVSNPASESQIDKLFTVGSAHSQVAKLKKRNNATMINFNKVKFFKEPDASLWISKKKKSSRQKGLLAGSHRLDRGKYSIDHMLHAYSPQSGAKESIESTEVISEKALSEGNHQNDKRKRSDEDLLGPLMRQKKRKKLTIKPKQSQPTASATHPGMKKKRTNIKLEKKYTMTYIRGVIISQSLSTGQNIEWPKVAELFDKRYTAEMLRRQWPKHRKLLGYRGLQQARKNWENVLMNRITDGIITEQHLLDYDLAQMIDIWQKADPDFVTNKADFVLYKNYDENLSDMSFKTYHPSNGAELFKDALSLIDKEIHYANALFVYSLDNDSERRILKDTEEPTELERAKSSLKALFATGPKEFSSDKARSIFSKTHNTIYAQALSQLEDEKAIAFLGEDSSIKFALTDKLLSVADCKMDEDFFHAAVRFYDCIDEVSSVGSGLIISKTAPDGCFGVLLNLLAEGKVKLTRVDRKPPSLKSYSTKSQDRRKLESDFIISQFKSISDDALKPQAPPVGPPCSRIWIDLNGKFNAPLWLKSVCLLIRCVVFRPGARLVALCDRMYPFLERFEVKLIMDWLVARNIVREGAYGGYWILPSWYLALHI